MFNKLDLVGLVLARCSCIYWRNF